jgi:hypothetical protein
MNSIIRIIQFCLGVLIVASISFWSTSASAHCKGNHTGDHPHCATSPPPPPPPPPPTTTTTVCVHVRACACVLCAPLFRVFYMFPGGGGISNPQVHFTTKPITNSRGWCGVTHVGVQIILTHCHGNFYSSPTSSEARIIFYNPNNPNNPNDKVTTKFCF